MRIEVRHVHEDVRRAPLYVLMMVKNYRRVSCATCVLQALTICVMRNGRSQCSNHALNLGRRLLDVVCRANFVRLPTNRSAPARFGMESCWRWRPSHMICANTFRGIIRVINGWLMCARFTASSWHCRHLHLVCNGWVLSSMTSLEMRDWSDLRESCRLWYMIHVGWGHELWCAPWCALVE